MYYAGQGTTRIDACLACMSPNQDAAAYFAAVRLKQRHARAAHWLPTVLRMLIDLLIKSITMAEDKAASVAVVGLGPYTHRLQLSIVH